MENKQEMAQELDLGQMENVPGGTGNDENTKRCPYCGQMIPTENLQFKRHLCTCPKKPKPITIC